MKIVLFRDGRPGVAARLPGEDPAVELSDLLGGALTFTPLNDRLKVVTLAEGEKLQLPIRYTLRRRFREPEPIAGDCAVVAVRQDGVLRDVTLQEVAEVRDIFIRAVME